MPKNLPAFSVAEAVEKAKEIPGDEIVAGASASLQSKHERVATREESNSCRYTRPDCGSSSPAPT